MRVPKPETGLYEAQAGDSYYRLSGGVRLENICNHFMPFILQIAVILLLEHRRPQRALAWLFITFCCPPAGLLFYYFWAMIIGRTVGSANAARRCFVKFAPMSPAKFRL